MKLMLNVLLRLAPSRPVSDVFPWTTACFHRSISFTAAWPAGDEEYFSDQILRSRLNPDPDRGDVK